MECESGGLNARRVLQAVRTSGGRGVDNEEEPPPFFRMRYVAQLSLSCCHRVAFKFFNFGRAPTSTHAVSGDHSIWFGALIVYT